MSESIKVFVRFRPVNRREREEGGGESACPITYFSDHKSVAVRGPKGKKDFSFDWIFDSTTVQDDAFNRIARPIIMDTLKGFNGTIFAYGQTGAGKTYTMFGKALTDTDSEHRGIIPRAARLIFSALMSDDDSEDLGLEHVEEVTIKASFLEIYREVIRDLLNPESDKMAKSGLKVRERADKTLYVEDLIEEYIANEEELFALIRLGEKSRSVAACRVAAGGAQASS
jgi:kinesin family protein 5